MDDELQFNNCKRKDTDLQVSGGRYRVAQSAQDQISARNIEWWHHKYDKESDTYTWTAIDTQSPPNVATPIEGLSLAGDEYLITAQTSGGDSLSCPIKLRRGASDPLIPPLILEPGKLPHPSHIIRFYTSVITIMVDLEQAYE